MKRESPHWKRRERRKNIATANEKRHAVAKAYQTIIGRNRYSQPRRGYAFRKYSDGRYYSDCSSSIALSYKQAGYPFYDNGGSCNPNTVGMYQAKNLEDVPVNIQSGVIQNPEVLRIGDMLLFAGSDNSRRYIDCVGHVEMVGKISGNRVTLYGHGSGRPRATEMNAYCRSRHAKKTNTVIGHKGLLKVRRFILDDEAEIVAAERNLRRGCVGADVMKLQEKLLLLGYELPKYGADGDFGSETEAALKKFQRDAHLAVDGICGEKTRAALVCAQAGAGGRIRVTAAVSANVRTGPGTGYASIGVVRRDEEYAFSQTAENGWRCISVQGKTGWISPKMCGVI